MYWGPADGLSRCPLPLSQVMGVNFGLYVLDLYDSRLYRDFSPMTADGHPCWRHAPSTAATGGVFRKTERLWRVIVCTYLYVLVVQSGDCPLPG